jgi:periplasmic divalent cation tolerance protein
MIHIYIQYPTLKEARRISKMLLNKHLAACVVFVRHEGMYWWRGKLNQGKGIMTYVVTQKKHYKKIETLVNKLHSYEVPAIFELPIGRVLPSYEKWLKKETN